MIEAAVLTGGRSRRMGRDKALLPIQGEAQAARIVRLLAEAGLRCTVLGKEPVPGAAFLADDETVANPVHALQRFKPSAPFVFVSSCDLPRFDPRLVEVLAGEMRDAEAVVPFVDGFRQPLVALYLASAFSKIPEADCPMGWLDALNVRLLDEEALLENGIHPDATRGANTPAELEALVGNPQ